MLQKLKTEYKQRIKDDQELQLKIAKLFNKKNIITVQRWVAADNPILTIPDVQNIIREHEGLDKETVLTEGNKQAATA